MRLLLPIFDTKDTWTNYIEVAPGGDSSEVLELWLQEQKWFKCIAISGQFNAGKTLLLSALTGRSFPSGNNVSTQGISAVHVKEQNMLLLDSAGTDSVETRHLSDKEGDTLEEIREHFCSEILMDMSTNFVHVVGKLTRQSMRGLWCHLKRIQQRQKSDMTVVYNLHPHQRTSEQASCGSQT